MDTFKFGLKGVNAHQEHLVDGSRNQASHVEDYAVDETQKWCGRYQKQCVR